MQKFFPKKDDRVEANIFAKPIAMTEEQRRDRLQKIIEAERRRLQLKNLDEFASLIGFHSRQAMSYWFMKKDPLDMAASSMEKLAKLRGQSLVEIMAEIRGEEEGDRHLPKLAIEQAKAHYEKALLTLVKSASSSEITINLSVSIDTRNHAYLESCLFSQDMEKKEKNAGRTIRNALQEKGFDLADERSLSVAIEMFLKCCLPLEGDQMALDSIETAIRYPETPIPRQYLFGVTWGLNNFLGKECSLENVGYEGDFRRDPKKRNGSPST